MNEQRRKDPRAGTARPDLPGDDVVRAEIARTLPRQRFFAEKASGIERVDVVDRRALDGDVELLVVRIHPRRDHDGGDRMSRSVGTAASDTSPDAAGHLYFVPIVWSDESPSPGMAPLVDAGAIHGYDALADAGSAATVASALASESTGEASFHLLDGADAPTSTGARPMGVEQSNTSVIFGDGLMCKFFRRLHAGPNPDVELTAALTDAGCAAVPPLTGWATLRLGAEDFTVAMWQAFIPGATDGWALSLEASRDAAESRGAGGDFTDAAAALGAAVAEVHRFLAPVEPAGRRVPADRLVAPMGERLATVAAVVPRIAELSDAISRIYDTAAASGGEDLPVQRIHGDLHLGQVLRAPDGWKLIDFEGEPARPWPERREPDHPLRDIAGMIRSFDYAAHFPLMGGGADNGDADTGDSGSESRASAEPAKPTAAAAAAAATAAGWSAAHTEAFLRGYRETTDARNAAESDAVDALLDAYVLDKAVYECLYEAQHRPDWLPIPMAAVERILDDAH